jgi:hypothetical protein
MADFEKDDFKVNVKQLQERHGQLRRGMVVRLDSLSGAFFACQRVERNGRWYVAFYLKGAPDRPSVQTMITQQEAIGLARFIHDAAGDIGENAPDNFLEVIADPGAPFRKGSGLAGGPVRPGPDSTTVVVESPTAVSPSSKKGGDDA